MQKNNSKKKIRRVKKVKAWAIYFKGTEHDNETPGLCNWGNGHDEPTPINVYETKREALDALSSNHLVLQDEFNIVPCTISYSLPKKKKK